MVGEESLPTIGRDVPQLSDKHRKLGSRVDGI